MTHQIIKMTIPKNSWNGSYDISNTDYTEKKTRNYSKKWMIHQKSSHVHSR